MQNRRTAGFGLFELLLVVVALAVLASILWPVLFPERHGIKQTQCTSNLRWMTTALQMDAQEGRYLGTDWALRLEKKGVARKMFMCNYSTAKEGQSAYAYNSLLIRPDGTGVAESQVFAPTEVGAFCDADPVGDLSALIGGSVAGKAGNRIAHPASRHAKGVIVGFCDGHAKYMPGVYKAGMRDLSSPIMRAMYLPVNLGALDAVGGAVNTLPTSTDTSTYTIGGDSCTEALIRTAAYAYAASSSKAVITTRGFRGQYDLAGRDKNYLWGGGDGKAKGQRIIGHDAMLVIVNKNCKISAIAQETNLYPTGSRIMREDQTYLATPENIYRLFTIGYIENSLSCYTYNTDSGSRAFFTAKFANGKGISKRAIEVANDSEMMGAVAKDPYGIGYLSSALVDLDRVQVLALSTPQGDFCYPSGNVKTRWQLPKSLKNWPTYRDLYVVASPGAAKPLALFEPGHTFLQNPLYRLGFERP